jgi:hypothetical protein
MESLFVTTTTDLGIDDCFTGEHTIMILAMAVDAGDFIGMSTGLPLADRRRRFLPMAVDAVISDNSPGKQEDHEQTSQLSNQNFHYHSPWMSL